MQHNALIFVIVVCLWGIASSRHRTGVFMTLGLTLTICGCLAALDVTPNLERAFAFYTYGLVSICWSFVWRLLVRPRWLHATMRWRSAAAAAHFCGVIDRRSAERRSNRRHWT